MVITDDEQAHEALMALREFFRRDFSWGDDDEYFLDWISAWQTSRQDEILEEAHGSRERF
jgi:hypothetical protein